MMTVTSQRFSSLLAFCTAACLLLCGCHRSSEGENGGAVLVLVAASTQDAVRAAADLFEQEQGAKIRLNADASSSLGLQIANDAPGDLFLPAHEKWAEFVREKGYAHESCLLLGNSLVLVVPRGNPAHITGPADLTGPAVTHLALAGPTVPAGVYARQALKKLHLWDELDKHHKIASGEDVRVTLAYVERGEAEAGLVYATDAKISDRVETVYTFAASTHEPIQYPLVLLQAGAQKPAARQFYDFLQSPRAAEVFRRYGFTPLAQK
jgi:molybdate transport system substrate-binding protein